MIPIKFFVESPDDINFIKQYCNLILGGSIKDPDFTIMGGWSGYKTGGEALQEFAINESLGFRNILILDADNDYKQRQLKIKADQKKLSFNANVFLIPDNEHNGNLESLLTEIAVDKKLIDCFKGYEECVKDYNKPLDKSRIYTYLDTLLHPYVPKSKDDDLRLIKNCDFSNTAHWDLNLPYLTPLRDFLQPFFNP